MMVLNHNDECTIRKISNMRMYIMYNNKEWREREREREEREREREKRE